MIATIAASRVTQSLLPLQAFIAPSNFDASAQNVNIHQIFSMYDNANKAYGYTFSDVYNTLTLAAASGVSYRYGYTRGGVDYVFDVASAVNPFTAAIDTKRWVIVNSVSAINYQASLNKGSVWGYVSSRCINIYSLGNSYLKYVHIQDETKTSVIGTQTFSNTNITGILHISGSTTSLGYLSFFQCPLITSVIIPTSVTYILQQAFSESNGFDTIIIPPNCNVSNYAFSGCIGIKYITINTGTYGTSVFGGCSNVLYYNSLAMVAPTVQTNTFGNYAKPLHVKVGATGYNVAPWTNTAIFSSIIYDL